MKSKKMIMNSLKKIEYILEKILKLDRDPRRQSELIAGLPKQEIIDTFANHKLLPPDLLIQIYEKYNGILWLNPFFSFLSLESAFELYNAYRDIKKDCNDFAWESTWFPIFDQNADIQICINLENLSLITVDLECDSTEVIANHYEDYLDALVEVFEMGSYILQPYDSIELDELVWDELREKYKISNM